MPRLRSPAKGETRRENGDYVRVSTDRQTQAQTIEQQLERLKAHLETEGETLSSENIFRDDGYSGASLNRPGLDQLRDRVREKAYSA
jgi:site-specific DNA recombinase